MRQPKLSTRSTTYVARNALCPASTNATCHLQRHGEVLEDITPADSPNDAPADAPIDDTDAPDTDAPATDAPGTDSPGTTDAPEPDVTPADTPIDDDTDAPDTDAPTPATDAPDGSTDAPEPDVSPADTPDDDDTDAPDTDAPSPATDAPDGTTDAPEPDVSPADTPDDDDTDAPDTDAPTPATDAPDGSTNAPGPDSTQAPDVPEEGIEPAEGPVDPPADAPVDQPVVDPPPADTCSTQTGTIVDAVVCDAGTVQRPTFADILCDAETATCQASCCRVSCASDALCGITFGTAKLFPTDAALQAAITCPNDDCTATECCVDLVCTDIPMVCLATESLVATAAATTCATECTSTTCCEANTVISCASDDECRALGDVDSVCTDNTLMGSGAICVCSTGFVRFPKLGGQQAEMCVPDGLSIEDLLNLVVPFAFNIRFGEGVFALMTPGLRAQMEGAVRGAWRRGAVSVVFREGSIVVAGSGDAQYPFPTADGLKSAAAVVQEANKAIFGNSITSAISSVTSGCTVPTPGANATVPVPRADGSVLCVIVGCSEDYIFQDLTCVPKSGRGLDTDSDDNQAGVIAGSVVGGVVGLCLIIAIVIFVIFKCMAKPPEEEKKTDEHEPIYTDDRAGDKDAETPDVTHEPFHDVEKKDAADNV